MKQPRDYGTSFHLRVKRYYIIVCFNWDKAAQLTKSTLSWASQWKLLLTNKIVTMVTKLTFSSW